jgi:hypothetical protein
MNLVRQSGPGAAIARWLAAVVLLAWSALAFGQANPRNFDHNRTGFTLSGTHVGLPCEGCHQNGTFKGTPRDCASCHTAGLPFAKNNTVKPARHIPSVVGCEVCHSNQTFVGRNKFRHETVIATVRCETCHTGNGATGKSQQHMPVASNQLCSDCHKSFTDWLAGTVFTHAEVATANRCDVCHNGRFPPADGEDADHVPYRGLSGGVFPNCDTCHKNFVDFRRARVHGSAVVLRDCRVCHDNNRFLPAVGQPATPSHFNAPPDCEVCHQSTFNWSDVTVVDVAGLAARNAQKAALTRKTAVIRPATAVKPANHIPVPATATCDTCHRSKSNMAVAVRMDHRAVAGTGCKTCHNGAFTSQGATGARGKPANHIPEVALLNGASMDCSACHRTAASWANVRMEHNGSQGGVAGACKTCHQAGTAFLGTMEKRPLTHLRTKASATGGAAAQDCSTSGCHRPQGRSGASYKSWG